MRAGIFKIPTPPASGQAFALKPCCLVKKAGFSLPSAPISAQSISMAYAIIQSGGHQFRVKQGDVIEIDDLGAEPGSEITFSEVLLAGEGAGVKVGAPHLAGASVTGEVVEEIKCDKVVAFKFKRRKGYHRTVGHRQRQTRVSIKAINA